VPQRTGSFCTGTGARLYAGGAAACRLPGLGMNGSDGGFGASNPHVAEIGRAASRDATGYALNFDCGEVAGEVGRCGTPKLVSPDGLVGHNTGHLSGLFDWGTLDASNSTGFMPAAGRVRDFRAPCANGEDREAAVPASEHCALVFAGLGHAGLVTRHSVRIYRFF
jgi:hypothetical protein